MDAVSGTISVRFGGSPRGELLESLRCAGVQLNAHAETLLDQPLFDNPGEQTMRFAERSVAQLGLPDGGVLTEVFGAARSAGLNLVPLEAAPWLRLATLAQQASPDSELSAGRAPDGAITVASDPVNDDPNFPKGFYVRVVDREPWLRGYRCDDTYVFGPEQRFFFECPNPAKSTSGADHAC